MHSSERLASIHSELVSSGGRPGRPYLSALKHKIVKKSGEELLTIAEAADNSRRPTCLATGLYDCAFDALCRYKLLEPTETELLLSLPGRPGHTRATPNAFSHAAKQEEERAFTERYVRRAWARTWCTMLGLNIFACFRDTAAGVDTRARRPTGTTAARSGPYPLIHPSDDMDGSEGHQPPRRLGGNSIGTANTPVVVLSDRQKMAGSRAGAWGGIPTPARRPSRHADDREAAASSSGMSEGATSGTLLMRQGTDSSGRGTEPPGAASPILFSTDRSTAVSLNDVSSVEGGSSRSGVTEQGLDSSGLDTEYEDDDQPPASRSMSADEGNDAARDSSARFSSASRSPTTCVSSAHAGASGRGLMTADGFEGRCRQGSPSAAESAARFLSAPGTPASGAHSARSGASGRGLMTADGIEEIYRRGSNSAARFSSAPGTLASGVRSAQAGASGRGLMTADGFEGRCRQGSPSVAESATCFLSAPGTPASDAHSTQSGASGRELLTTGGLGRSYQLGSPSVSAKRNDFVLSKRPPIPRDIPRPRGALFISSDDVSGSESGSVKADSSGRKIIRRGESKEDQFDILRPSEGREHDTDRIDGEIGGGGRGRGGSGKLPLGILKSRPPVDSDVPTRRGGARFAAAASSSAPPRNSNGIPGHDWPDGEGFDERYGCDGSSGSSGRNARSLPRVPWGVRPPTEVDIPRRRSVDTSGYASGSKLPSTGSDGIISVRPPALPRVPWGSRGPTEVDLPRRRSVDISGHSDSFAGEGKLPSTGSDGATSSHPVVLSRVPWGVRPPAEVDIPRRRSVDMSGHSDSCAGERKLPSAGSDGVTSSHPVVLPRVPWGLRGPTEVDIPRRRSVDISGHSDSFAGESKLPRTGPDRRTLHHPPDQSERPGAKSSRFPMDFRSNPTESSLPRRRSLHPPAWDQSVGTSSHSLHASSRYEEDGDASGRSGGREMGGAGADGGIDLSGLDASTGGGKSWEGGRGGWALLGRAPVVIDLPRRSSGYSADSSAHSKETIELGSFSQRHAGDGLRPEIGRTIGEERSSYVSGIEGGSVLAGLTGRKPRPVESDLPRRRWLPEIPPPPEGEIALPVAEGSSSGGGGTSGARAEEDGDGSGSSMSASLSLSRSSSASARWHIGLKSRAPVAIDLPRRSSSYSTDRSLRSVGRLSKADDQSVRLHQEEDRGAGDTKSDEGDGIGPTRQDFHGSTASAGRKSTLAGHKRTPVDIGLPRHRPVALFTAGRSGMAGGVVEEGEAEVGVPDSPRVD